jgi:O-antigen/teichoic acid export membrane protein
VSESYSQLAARGMAWNTAALVVGRITGFAAQLVLGWLLSRDDFGTYAIALSLSVIVLTLRATGAQKLLIQRGGQYDELAHPLAVISLLINVVGMLVLWMAAPLLAQYFNAPAIVPLMRVIGLSMPLGVPADILRARLSIELRFRELALLNAGALMLTQALTVILALAGMGPMSFALPLAVVAAVDSLVLWRIVGWWPAGRPLERKRFTELFAAAKWIILCGFASALIVQGNHLVVGKMETREVTGLFFFGFQLTTAVALFFNTGMQRVLMPTLTRLSDDGRRQGQAYLKSVRVLVASAAPVCLWGVLLADPVMHVLWAGKWDDAIPVVQWLTAILPIYVLTAINAAVLEARGLWRANTIFHFLSAAGTIASAWYGASRGGLWEITLAAASFRLGFSLLNGVLVAQIMGLSRTAFLGAALPPFIACVAVAATVAELAAQVADEWPWWLQMLVVSLLYWVLTAAVYFVLFRQRVSEAAGAMGGARFAGTHPAGDAERLGERASEVK